MSSFSSPLLCSVGWGARGLNVHLFRHVYGVADEAGNGLVQAAVVHHTSGRGIARHTGELHVRDEGTAPDTVSLTGVHGLNGEADLVDSVISAEASHGHPLGHAWLQN